MNNLRSVFICDNKFCEFSVDDVSSDILYRINGENVGKAAFQTNTPRFAIFDNSLWSQVYRRTVGGENHTSIRVFLFKGALHLVVEFDLPTRVTPTAVHWTIALIVLGLFEDEDSDLF